MGLILGVCFMVICFMYYATCKKMSLSRTIDTSEISQINAGGLCLCLHRTP